MIDRNVSDSLNPIKLIWTAPSRKMAPLPGVSVA